MTTRQSGKKQRTNLTLVETTGGLLRSSNTIRALGKLYEDASENLVLRLLCRRMLEILKDSSGVKYIRAWRPSIEELYGAAVIDENLPTVIKSRLQELLVAMELDDVKLCLV